MFLSNHLFGNSLPSPIIFYHSPDYGELSQPWTISDQGMPGTFNMAYGTCRCLGTLVEGMIGEAGLESWSLPLPTWPLNLLRAWKYEINKYPFGVPRSSHRQKNTLRSQCHTEGAKLSPMSPWPPWPVGKARGWSGTVRWKKWKAVKAAGIPFSLGIKMGSGTNTF